MKKQRNRSMNKRGAKHSHKPAGSKLARFVAEHRFGTFRGAVVTQ